METRSALRAMLVVARVSVALVQSTGFQVADTQLGATPRLCMVQTAFPSK